MPWRVEQRESCPASKPWAVVKESDGSVVACVTGDTLVWGSRPTRSTTRWYEGEIIEITTMGEQFLTITPNHPVLTPGGWVAAGSLNEGMDIVSCASGERKEPAAPYDYQMPSRIKDVAASDWELRSVVTRTVPVTAEDFHGDGVGSKVCIVRTDSFIDDALNSHFAKPRSNDSFGGRIDVTGSVEFALPGECSPDLFLRSNLAAWPSLPMCLRPLSFLRRHTRKRKAERFASSSNGSVVAPEYPYDGRLVDSMLCSNVRGGEPIKVLVDDGLLIRKRTASVVRGAQATDLHSHASQVGTDSSARDAVPTSERLARLTGCVGIDQIAGIRRLPFSGHVYNLTTVDGWYVADGFIIHNCHETKDDAEGQLAALYANEPEARAAGQWQALYGNLAGRWLVASAQIGAVPPAEIGDLVYLGEPGELINQLYSYRLGHACQGAGMGGVMHARRVLATELDISEPTLTAYVQAGGPMVLSNGGWANMVRAVIYMTSGRNAQHDRLAAL